MGTISEKISKLTLRSALSLSYTLTFTILVGIAFLTIYLISAAYRVDEFNRRLKDRTLTTFTILLQVDQIDREILQLFDKNTINNLSEEKILLFDSSGALIYGSIDDTKIDYPAPILNRLRSGEQEIETTEGEYELLGIGFRSAGKTYYGIAKAYDRYGRSKMRFLKAVLRTPIKLTTLRRSKLTTCFAGEEKGFTHEMSGV